MAATSTEKLQSTNLSTTTTASAEMNPVHRRRKKVAATHQNPMTDKSAVSALPSSSSAAATAAAESPTASQSLIGTAIERFHQQYTKNMDDNENDSNSKANSPMSCRNANVKSRSNNADVFPLDDDRHIADSVEIPIDQTDSENQKTMMTIHEVSSKKSVLVCCWNGTCNRIGMYFHVYIFHRRLMKSNIKKINRLIF